jgi:hypothetical protein
MEERRAVRAEGTVECGIGVHSEVSGWECLGRSEVCGMELETAWELVYEVCSER